MRLLVTAGNTQVPIDKVRCITNIFTGRTGARLGLFGHQQGHEVTLLTSHPDTVAEEAADPTALSSRWRVERYRTFDDLRALMEKYIAAGAVDTVIHSAAVSDYLAAGIYAPLEGTAFDPATGTWTEPARMMDRMAGKVKSDEPELWLRMTRAPKLIDLIRSTWGFRGVLVKFKLEVGKSDADLLQIAERSRCQSGANLMVANTLEEAQQWAFLGPVNGGYEKLTRDDLPRHLFEAIQQESVTLAQQGHLRETHHG
jgi:phosphopantothenoylcysteine synthetase/decarboxylase